MITTTQLFTIYDKVTERIAPIFESPNVASAKRQCINMFKGKGLDTKDYILVHYGEVDNLQIKLLDHTYLYEFTEFMEGEI